MRRGDTPTIRVFIHGIDLQLLENIEITWQQGNKLLVKSLEAGEIELVEGAEYVKVSYSQEETLSFNDGKIEIQVRVKTKDNRSVGSDIFMKELGRILRDGVI